MSSPQANKSLVIRAAAILTTGVVNSNAFLINRAWDKAFTVEVRFTLGSLTNCTFKHLVSTDDVTYIELDTSASGVVSWVPTATGNRAFALAAPGYTYYRMSAQGTGVTTSSTATITARWMPRGN